MHPAKLLTHNGSILFAYAATDGKDYFCSISLEHLSYYSYSAELSMSGLWFEDCELGKKLRHPITRTVTEMDNMLFSCLTMNTQPLHIDRHFAAQSEFGQPLMNSMFTLALVIGISVNDTTLGTLVAQLGLTDVKFPAPLFQGDSIRVETEIVSTRESKSRPNSGIVEFAHRAYKQDGSLVAECKRTALLLRRPKA